LRFLKANPPGCLRCSSDAAIALKRPAGGARLPGATRSPRAGAQSSRLPPRRVPVSHGFGVDRRPHKHQPSSVRSQAKVPRDHGGSDSVTR
jgi:hypothetical protein